MIVAFHWQSKYVALGHELLDHWVQVVASLVSIYPKDTEAPPAGVDDMTKLAYLHEPGVLHNLACRYGLNEIYVSAPGLPILHMFAESKIAFSVRCLTLVNDPTDVHREHLDCCQPFPEAAASL